MLRLMAVSRWAAVAVLSVLLGCLAAAPAAADKKAGDTAFEAGNYAAAFA